MRPGSRERSPGSVDPLGSRERPAHDITSGAGIFVHREDVSGQLTTKGETMVLLCSREAAPRFPVSNAMRGRTVHREVVSGPLTTQHQAA